MLLLRVKGRRLYQNPFHLVSFRAGKPKRLRGMGGSLSKTCIVEMAELLRASFCEVWPVRRELIDLIGRLRGHPRKDQRLAIGRKHQIVIRAPDDLLHGDALLDVDAVDWNLSFVFRREINGLGIG